MIVAKSPRRIGTSRHSAVAAPVTGSPRIAHRSRAAVAKVSPDETTPLPIGLAVASSTAVVDGGASLAAEVDRLEQELTIARARIAALEAAQRHALDRLAWAIDSLQHLVEDAAG